MVFSASLRDNLDPLHLHTDVQLFDALKKTRLADVVRQKLAPVDPMTGGQGLDADVDHETTFSAGKMCFVFINSQLNFKIGYKIPHNKSRCLQIV